MSRLKDVLFIVGFAIIVVVLAIRSDAATITTVTGKIQTPSGSALTSSTYVLFDLEYCGQNQPRIAGTTQLPALELKLTLNRGIDSSGNISTSLYGNDQITCGVTLGGTRWRVTYVVAGNPGPSCDYNITGSTWDLNTQVCLAVAPVVTPPTGDSTYARLDGGNSPFHAIIDSCGGNGWYVVGSSCYPTIAAARTAAGIASVYIPMTASNTDAAVNGNDSILDLRHNMVASSHYFGCSWPMTGSPGGFDCAFESNSAGDLYPALHNNHVDPKTTTTQSLTIGANTVTVGDASLFGNGGGSPLQVGRGTTNYEGVPAANWSVIDGTHLSITCAKAHTIGDPNNDSYTSIDIEELGLTVIDTGLFMSFRNHKPAQVSGHGEPMLWLEANSNAVLQYPQNTADSWPYNALGLAVPIGGFSAGSGEHNTAKTPADAVIRNTSTSVCARLKNNAGTNGLSSCDSTIILGQTFVPSSPGNTTATLGKDANAFRQLWIGTSATAQTAIQSSATAARNFFLPDISGTAALSDAAQSFSALETFTSGVKLGSSGSTLSDSRALIQSVNDCGATTTCANTANNSFHEVIGTVTLSAGAASLTGITGFTTIHGCTCTDQTAVAACKAVPASSSSVTFAGTGTDVLFYRCIGN